MDARHCPRTSAPRILSGSVANCGDEPAGKSGLLGSTAWNLRMGRVNCPAPRATCGSLTRVRDPTLFRSRGIPFLHFLAFSLEVGFYRQLGVERVSPAFMLSLRGRSKSVLQSYECRKCLGICVYIILFSSASRRREFGLRLSIILTLYLQYE